MIAKRMIPIIVFFYLFLPGCEEQESMGSKRLVGQWQMCEIYGGGSIWTKTDSPVYRLEFMIDGIYFISVNDSTICNGVYNRLNDTLVHFMPQNCPFRVESEEVIERLTSDTLVITNTSIPILSYMQHEKYSRVR